MTLTIDHNVPEPRLNIEKIHNHFSCNCAMVALFHISKKECLVTQAGELTDSPQFARSSSRASPSIIHCLNVHICQNDSIAPPTNFQLLSPAPVCNPQLWNLLHMLRTPIPTKKPLGPMGHTLQEVGHLDLKIHTFPFCTHFWGIFKNVLLLQFSCYSPQTLITGTHTSELQKLWTVFAIFASSWNGAPYNTNCSF